MSQVLESYERQYRDLAADLSRKCRATDGTGGEEADERDVRSGLEEAESLVRRMDLEARTLASAAERAKQLEKVKKFKLELTDMKREVKKRWAGGGDPSSRDRLLLAGGGGKGSSAMPVAAAQRGRMVEATERLGRATEQVEESRRNLLEAEELGVSILQDLHHQRDTLAHTRDTLRKVDDDVGTARRKLNSVGRRLSQHKWIVAAVIIVLVFAIIMVALIKASSHSHSGG